MREMKDSGIEWIGDIPDTWTIKRMLYCLDSVVDYRGKTPEKVDCIEVKNKVVTNMINTGIDTAIVANLRYFRKIPFISGKMKYKLSILYTIFIPKIYNMKII